MPFYNLTVYYIIHCARYTRDISSTGFCHRWGAFLGILGEKCQNQRILESTASIFLCIYSHVLVLSTSAQCTPEFCAETVITLIHEPKELHEKAALNDSAI